MANIGTIPSNFQAILNMLKKQEGGRLHRNPGEKDITNGYGIYKYVHPNADIWTYYNKLAVAVGITEPSYNWSDINLKVVQANVDPAEELWLSYLFYKDYYAPICLEQCDEIITPAIASIYANGSKLCIRSMQGALCKLYRDYVKDASFPSDFAIDGSFGPATKAWFLKVSTLDKRLIQEFKRQFLSHCKYEYQRLAESNPEKFGKFLKGWNNRVDSLI